MKAYNYLIKKAFRDNEDLDTNTLKSIILEELITNDMKSYVEKIKNTKEGTVESNYDYTSKVLTFDHDCITRNLYSKYMKSGLDYTEENFKRFKNINDLLVIFNELSHVKQFRDSKEQRTSGALKNLLDDGVELKTRYPNNLTTREQNLYNFLYNDILIERDAQIEAILNILEINRQNGLLRESEIKILNSKLFEIMIKGYNEQLCPSEAYYKLRGKIKEYKDIKFVDSDYDNLTRIKWGMPLDIEEIKFLHSLRRTSINNPNVENEILTYKKHS